MLDRQELDNAIFELLGVTNKREREDLLGRLYGYLREFFENTRQKEEKAISNKNRSKRQTSTTPAELASLILAEIRENFSILARTYGDFVDMDRLYSTFELPTDGTPEVYYEDMFTTQGSVKFMRGKKQIALLPAKNPEQAALLTLIAHEGVRGLVRVPLYPDDCVQLQHSYSSFCEQRDKKVRSLIAERTGDPDLQERIFQLTVDMLAAVK